MPTRDAGGESGTFFVSLDMARLRELEGSTEDIGGALPEDIDLESADGFENADPLVAYPAVGVFGAALGVAFGLVPYGFGDQVLSGFGGGPSGGQGTDTSNAETETDVSVDSVLMVESAFVLEGSFDPATVADATTNFEATDERDGYQVYEGTGGGDGFVDTEGLAFAVSEDAIVALSGGEGDAQERIDRVIDTAAGDADRLTDDDDGDWALKTAGNGVVALGAFGVEPDEAGGSSGGQGVQVESIFDQADGVVSSLMLDGDTVTGTIAAVFPEGEVPSRSDLESAVGSTASDLDLTIDGGRVDVSGTWEASAATPTDGGA